MTQSPHRFDQQDDRHNQESWLLSRTGLVTVGVVAILGFFRDFLRRHLSYCARLLSDIALASVPAGVS